MKSIGGYMFLFGLISTVLYFFDMELKILMWIETWGTTVGWAIRGGLMALGAGLWFLGGKKEDAAA
jgi:hypothetical protein